MGYEENLFIEFEDFSKKLLRKICSPIINSKIPAELSYWAKSQADSKSNMQHKKDNNIKEDNLLSIKKIISIGTLCNQQRIIYQLQTTLLLSLADGNQESIMEEKSSQCKKTE